MDVLWAMYPHSIFQSLTWNYHLPESWQPTPIFLPGKSVDSGAWRTAVHSVAQSQIRLKRLSMHECIGEGNGNPLQYSCLENPMEGGALRATVHGIAQVFPHICSLCIIEELQFLLFLQNCSRRDQRLFSISAWFSSQHHFFLSPTPTHCSYQKCLRSLPIC